MKIFTFEFYSYLDLGKILHEIKCFHDDDTPPGLFLGCKLKMTVKINFQFFLIINELKPGHGLIEAIFCRLENRNFTSLS